jgi:hypothetical protein
MHARRERFRKLTSSRVGEIQIHRSTKCLVMRLCVEFGVLLLIVMPDPYLSRP